MFLLATLVSFLSASAWSIATPEFSVADENAHAVKAIGTWQGQWVGYLRDDAKHPVFDLPEEYQYDSGSVCFVRAPAADASCSTPIGEGVGTLWFDTWTGNYNPLYSVLVGWPSALLSGEAGIYGMRVVSALLGSVLLGLAFVAAAAGRGARWMTLGTLFALAPMVTHFLGAVNPQGFEMASAVLLWVALLRLLDDGAGVDSALSRSALWVMVVVGVIGLANARATGPFWVVVVVVLCLVVAGGRATVTLFRNPRTYLWFIPMAAGGLFSVAWTLTAGTLGSQADPQDAPLVGASWFDGVATMLLLTPGFVSEVGGSYGWLDVPLPVAVPVAFFVALAAFLTVALMVFARHERLLLLAVVGACVLVPVFVQAASIAQTGLIWQGRYGLFLYLGVPIVAGYLLARTPSADAVGSHRALRLTVFIALAANALGGLFAAIQRYTVGVEGGVVDALFDPTWVPVAGPILPLVMMALSWMLAIVLLDVTTEGLERRPTRLTVSAATGSA